MKPTRTEEDNQAGIHAFLDVLDILTRRRDYGIAVALALLTACVVVPAVYGFCWLIALALGVRV